MNYQADSIKTLSYFEHIRQYPGMYIGSKDINGLHHCVKEILSNCIDEYLNGAGSTVAVVLQKDGGIFIQDDGRGIPHGEHESGCSILQACFGIANTGGKFDNATGETGYNTSGGEHGTGGKAVNALSKQFIAITAREGISERVEFAKGEFVNYSKEEISANKHGTTVLFYPDETIFETTKFDVDKLKTLLQEESFLNKGLRFVFINGFDDTTTVYLSQNGLYDYVEYLTQNKELICDPIYLDEAEGKFRIELAIAYTKDYSSTFRIYTNNIPQEKGTHLTGFKTGFTSTINSYAREKGWLKDKDSNLTGSDFEEGQVLILNFRMIDPVFKGQNKEELSSSEGRTYVQRLTTQGLRKWLNKNDKFAKKIVDKALTARKAREAAKKARDAARGTKAKKTKSLREKMVTSKKFTDCASKDPQTRNLLIVEGDSAAGSAIEARNPETDAIYQLRGKIISCRKQDLEKVLANQEISDIIREIGAGFGEEFNLSRMRFNKVVITSDADADGASIELLLTTFFFTHMRALVEAGKLYRAVTPLYIIKKKGHEDLYFFTEEEMDNYRRVEKGAYDVTRAKGLGELDAAELHEVCFKHQRFKQITVSDAQKADELLEVLMGPAVEPRKQYIYDNATELGFEFD